MDREALISDVEAKRAEALAESSGQPSPEWEYGSRPDNGRLIKYERSRDVQTYRADRITFVKLANLLKSGESGIATDLMILNRDLESRDAHLQSVASTRRLSVSGLGWDIEPAAIEEKGPNAGSLRREAEDAADYCREVLKSIPSFRVMLKEMLEAIGPNLGVTEIVWNGWTPVDFVSVPPERLRINYGKSPDIRIKTDETPEGSVPPPGKLAISVPKPNGGFPFRKTMTRAASFLSVIKHGNVADWATFCEVYGMPVRWASYEKGTKSSTRDEILEALAAIGSDGYGVFPKGVELSLAESARGSGSHPYKEIVDWTEAKMSILYLGQNLSTEIGTDGSAVGSFAAAKVHENVKDSILVDDLIHEATWVEEQIFRPMLAYYAPHRRLPVPRFVRKFSEQVDRVAEAQLISIAVNDLGMEVEDKWAREVLDIPEIQRTLGDEKPVNSLLPGRPQAAPVSFDPFGG